MGGTSRKLFLSAVSSEFAGYRAELEAQLGDHFHVQTQEHFAQGGGRLLDHLDAYIRQCDAVVHLVGDGCGTVPTKPEVDALLARHPRLLGRRPGFARSLDGRFDELSYTQWEAVLALAHERPCFVFQTHGNAPREEGFVAADPEKASQKDHFARIAAEGQHYGSFDDARHLALEVWRAFARAGLVQQGVKIRPNNLPRSIGSLFKGRAEFLAQIRQSLLRPDAQATAITALPQVLHGLGGVGKTRAAIEYAVQHETDYAALLFVEASSPEALTRNLAQLAGPQVLDIPEQRATEESAQTSAVLRWLQSHDRWLLIVDNIDVEESAQALEQLYPSLRTGHVLITSRLSNWAADIDALELDVLAPHDAQQLLLERTGATAMGSEHERAARVLVQELGGLALALEQAAAYMRNRRLSPTQYLERWQKERTTLLEWARPSETRYPLSIAVTWQTSVAQLTVAGKRLLDVLAWLAPDPIPRSLLDVTVPGVEDADAAFADLAAYSLAAADETTIRVHRLVSSWAEIRRGCPHPIRSRASRCERWPPPNHPHPQRLRLQGEEALRGTGDIVDEGAETFSEVGYG